MTQHERSACSMAQPGPIGPGWTAGACPACRASAAPSGTRIEFIAHPSFDDPDARDAILAAMPGPPPPEVTRRARAPEGPRPELACLSEVPLLSREQEAHLFRKMNYLKSPGRAGACRLDPDRPRRADLEEFERLRNEAVAVKQQIIRANLRLVVSIARRYRGRARRPRRAGQHRQPRVDPRRRQVRLRPGLQVQHLCHLGDPQRPVPAIRKDGRLRERLALERRAIYRDTVDTRADPVEQQSAQDRRERIVAQLLGSARRARAADPRRPLRDRRCARGDAGADRRRAGDLEGAGAPDRVPRPGEAPPIRRRGRIPADECLSPEPRTPMSLTR